jgi:hypothetical protein
VVEQAGFISSPITLSQPERWFVDTVHALGVVGILVLRSLAYLTVTEGPEVQISRETLAHHSGRSIRTVSRAVGRLKALQLTEAAQPSPQSFDCWEPNVYKLTALGVHVAARLGTGGDAADVPARAIPAPPIPKEGFLENSQEQRSAPPMAHAETIAVFPGQRPAPGLGPELEPVVQGLEQADPRRFAHLRDWLHAKLRGGTPRRHVMEALAALRANLDRVRFWAGWVQHRLEDLARAEREAERARDRAGQDERDWRETVRRWEQERADGWPGGKTLGELIAALGGRPAQPHIAATSA